MRGVPAPGGVGRRPHVDLLAAQHSAVGADSGLGLGVPLLKMLSSWPRPEGCGGISSPSSPSSSTGKACTATAGRWSCEPTDWISLGVKCEGEGGGRAGRGWPWGAGAGLAWGEGIGDSAAARLFLIGAAQPLGGELVYSLLVLALDDLHHGRLEVPPWLGIGLG